MNVVRIFLVIVFVTGLIGNGLSIAVLSTKTIKQNKYKRLVLSLSVINTGIVLQCLIRVIFDYINEAKGLNVAAHHVCVVFNYIVCGSLLFALFQTLLICIERLNATFVNKSKRLTALTSPWSIVIGCMVSHLSMLIPLVLSLSTGSVNCSSAVSENLVFILTAYIPSTFMSVTVIVMYVVTLVRMVKLERQRKMAASTSDNNPTNHSMLKNMIIFGTIVALRIISTLPQSTLALISLYTGPTDTIKSLNRLMVLNLLIDPIIYCFVVKEYKDRIRLMFRKLFCKKPNAVTDISS